MSMYDYCWSKSRAYIYICPMQFIFATVKTYAGPSWLNTNSFFDKQGINL